MRSLSAIGLALVVSLATGGCGDDTTGVQDLLHADRGTADLVGQPAADLTGQPAADLTIQPLGDMPLGPPDLVPAASCTDGVKNGNETDTDCGGGCLPCADGKVCQVSSDCTSQVCGSGACAAPKCDDKVKNGTEADVDCGGSCPTKCPGGKTCTKGEDCATGQCMGGTCATSSCTDGMKNGDEADVDCGGSCPTACAPMKTCAKPTDCQSGVCTGGQCVAPTCGDKVKNGTETDVDCGGGCQGCAQGKVCVKDGDCSTQVCKAGTCDAPKCSDLNCDGWPDLVFGSHYTGGSYDGTGYAYFHGGPGATPAYTATNRSAMATHGTWKAAVADLNNDTYPDIVFASYASGGGTYTTDSIVYYGSKSGFSPSMSQALPSTGALDAALGDLNGDGFKDIVLAQYQDSASNFSVNSIVYWGSAKGFNSTNKLLLPTLGAHGVKLADLDGDGALDIVFANFRDNSQMVVSSYIYWNRGGTFSTTQRTMLPTVGALRVLPVDLNGDGFLDLVFAGHMGSPSDYAATSYIYWGSKTGFSTANRKSFPSYGTHDIQAADLDGDGKLEVVVPNYYAANSYNQISYILWGVHDWDYARRSELHSYGALNVAIADLDSDGKPDIVFANYHSSSAGYAAPSMVFWNTSSGFTNTKVTNLPTHGVYDVEVADLDKDGFNDVIFAQYYPYVGNSTIFWGSASGFSTGNVTNLPTVGATHVIVVK